MRFFPDTTHHYSCHPMVACKQTRKTSDGTEIQNFVGCVHVQRFNHEYCAFNLDIKCYNHVWSDGQMPTLI